MRRKLKDSALNVLPYLGQLSPFSKPVAPFCRPWFGRPTTAAFGVLDLGTTNLPRLACATPQTAASPPSPPSRFSLPAGDNPAASQLTRCGSEVIDPISENCGFPSQAPYTVGFLLLQRHRICKGQCVCVCVCWTSWANGFQGNAVRTVPRGVGKVRASC